MQTLITVEQLRAMLGDRSLVVFDCRFSLQDTAAGAKAYREAHVPGALFADVATDLSSPHIPGSTGRHPLPARQHWLRRLQAWGLRPAQQVVAYDDAGGAGAARLWWMLRWAGHEQVAVLDGGWQAWLAAQQPVTAALPATPERASFDYATLPPLTTLVEAAQVDAAHQVLLDARESPRFRGEVEPLDPVAGHIPGAQCSPYSGNLGPDGRFKPAAALREKFAVAAGSDQPLVCYCGSGITACHNILALRVAGLPEAALYAGSWSEWVTDPARPVARG